MIISLEKLWNKLEIRVLVMSSLGLQIFLLAIAGFRKHVISSRLARTTTITWHGPLALMFHWLLWLAYLLADYVATVALAYLPGSERTKATLESKTHHLLMFWAPFFILHLGGQDTITALSVEDNELWARHLLTLCSQVALAIYYYLSSNLEVGALRLPAALMFSVAIFKYAERVWSLQRASMSSLRSSMITKPDPGPNYAKFMQEYTSSNEAGLTATIKVEVEKHKGDLESQQPKEVPEETKDYEEVVCKAYVFFPIFKRLFVDLILSYKNREDSQKYFEGLKFKDAYKLIEIELSWMYEILHSKGSVIYAFKNYGWISRGITLVITTATLCIFAVADHAGYGGFETTLTYVLLGGAVSLEIIALGIMLLSLWTYAAMKESNSFNRLSKFLFSIQTKLRSETKPRWSEKMAQFSLITYSLEDKRCLWKCIIKSVGFKETWDNYRYTTYVPVKVGLKELVFRELKNKMKNIEDTASYRRFTSHRGQWALQRKGYYQEFGWSVEAEFDESILLWHIATDLLFHETEKSKSTLDKQSEQKSEPQPAQQLEDNPEQKQQQKKESSRDISQDISNYMLFLLIVRPFMMPAGIGQIRFGDTCAEAANFIQPLGEIEKRNIKKIKNGNADKGNIEKSNAVKRLLEVNTEYDPALIKGDRSKSVLFRGCKLAHQLKTEFTPEGKNEPDWDKMWRLISVVWVEILCFAASKCSGQFHAKQLSKGGELLTVIWFLMAHLGMGEQYRIEEGHARAKLIVSK
ncbi:uncharacterized protein LOC144545276 [Carex rostrata]